MRLICFTIVLSVVLCSQLNGQQSAAIAMRMPVWPVKANPSTGIGWSLFSRQYYGTSNWNASGITIRYCSLAGETSALLCRDGIPGFTWYHLYFSHYRKFKDISALLQLRFSLIGLKDRPPGFRPGGNLFVEWWVSETVTLQINLFDFTGWISPATILKGDPAMQFFLFHEPGRLIGLSAGFRMSPYQFGPVTAGTRVAFNDQLGITTMLDVLPLGFRLGVVWNLKGYRLQGWFEQKNGLGMSPVFLVSGGG